MTCSLMRAFSASCLCRSNAACRSRCIVMGSECICRRGLARSTVIAGLEWLTLSGRSRSRLREGQSTGEPDGTPVLLADSCPVGAIPSIAREHQLFQVHLVADPFHNGEGIVARLDVLNPAGFHVEPHLGVAHR